MEVNNSPTGIYQVFGQNLKKYRGASGLSQSKLAELCNISTNYIVQMELGRKFPSASVIETLAKVLEIHFHQLFVDDDLTEVSRKHIEKVEKTKADIIEEISTILDKRII